MKRIFILLGALQFAAALFAADKTPLNVRDFGATGDGVTKDTVALQKALDACATAGGGTVTVPDGIYLTGSLTLGAITTLDLAGHASLVGRSDGADEPLVNVRWEGEFREGHRSLIAEVKVQAEAPKSPPEVLAFEPHPQEYFKALRGDAPGE